MVPEPPILATPCIPMYISSLKKLIRVTGSKPMGQWVIRVNTCDPVATLLLVLVKVLTFSVWMFECTCTNQLYAFVALKNHILHA